MKLLRNKGILVKVFLITFLLLLLSALLIYAVIYFTTPKYYQEYRKSAIDSAADQLVETLEKTNYADCQSILSQFSDKYNVLVSLSDAEKKPGSVGFSSGVFIQIQSNVESNGENTTTAYYSTTSTSITSREIYSISKSLTFKDKTDTYYLYIGATMQPVEETSTVLSRLVPYVLTTILLIAVLGAFVFAKLISRPLIGINKTAKEMAKLNFKVKCDVKSRDEIGELAESLNALSGNLEASIEDLKEKNQILQDDIAKDRELEKKRKEFITTISHELKTPITILRSQLEGMIENIGIYRNRDKYLRHSLLVVGNMEELVCEMLDINRLENPSNQLKLNKVSLSRLLQSSVENQLPYALEKNIRLQACVEPDIVVMADEKLLKKAISNILINAIRHSPEEAVVTVGLKIEEGESFVSVENSGVHVKDAEIPHLFEAFYRPDKSRNRETGGHGLGLYIVRQIFDAHGFGYKMKNTADGIQFLVKIPGFV